MSKRVSCGGNHIFLACNQQDSAWRNLAYRNMPSSKKKCIAVGSGTAVATAGGATGIGIYFFLLFMTSVIMSNILLSPIPVLLFGELY